MARWKKNNWEGLPCYTTASLCYRNQDNLRYCGRLWSERRSTVDHLFCTVGNEQMLDQAKKHFKLPSSSDPLKKFMDTLFIIQVLAYVIVCL